MFRSARSKVTAIVHTICRKVYHPGMASLQYFNRSRVCNKCWVSL